MTKEDFFKLLKSEGGGGFEVEGYRPVVCKSYLCGVLRSNRRFMWMLMMVVRLERILINTQPYLVFDREQICIKFHKRSFEAWYLSIKEIPHIIT